VSAPSFAPLYWREQPVDHEPVERTVSLTAALLAAGETIPVTLNPDLQTTIRLVIVPLWASSLYGPSARDKLLIVCLTDRDRGAACSVVARGDDYRLSAEQFTDGLTFEQHEFVRAWFEAQLWPRIMAVRGVTEREAPT
jgi:hypothetical protein